MKTKFIILLALVFIISFVGCKEECDNFPGPQHAEFIGSSDWDGDFYKYIKEAQKTTLDFANIDELESTINRISSLNESELKEWYDKKGFVSQKTLYDNSITELGKLDSKESIETYKKKYQHFFLFNEVKEDEDLSPYLPSSKFGYSYICNVYGRVRINGVEHNFNDYTSFEDTDYAKYIRNRTKADEQWDNHLFRESSKRKFWAQAHRIGQQVQIEFTAHKKSMLGWNKYQTVYIIQLYSYDPKCWTYYDKLDLLRRQNPGSSAYNVYETPELASHTFFNLGTFYKGNIGKGDGYVQYYPIKLEMSISTRGQSGGLLVINYPTL